MSHCSMCFYVTTSKMLLLLSRFSRVRLCATPWPTRLPHPWASPGKSTGVGCHCLLLKTNFNKKNFITAQSSCYIETGDNAKTENSLNGKF